MLTDLSKAFDCLSHELLIAKLDTYGPDKRSLILIYNYLSNRRKRLKINDSFSSWSEILFGVPQGSILGPFLFNIFICNMSYLMVDFEIANYVDDSTPFSVKLDGRSVVDELEISTSILFTWLKNNYMKENTDKNHLLLSGNINNPTANIDGNVTESQDNQVLLDVTIDCNLFFNKPFDKLCKKAIAKLNALARISGYMNLPKRRIIMKLFMTSQFGYCPLIWMFYSRTLNNKINSIQERALRITYNDRKSSFEKLLRKDNTVSIHHINLQVLVIEIFKIKNNLTPKILNEIFQNRTSPYNLRKNSNVYVRQVQSLYHGTESLSFLGSKAWELVPEDIKYQKVLEFLITKLKIGYL